MSKISLKENFDQEPENDMKVIEELYYHSSYVPKYIVELKAALRESGIMPPKDSKLLTWKIKDEIQKTNFWKHGFIFVNKRVEADRSLIKDISDIDASKKFWPN